MAPTNFSADYERVAAARSNKVVSKRGQISEKVALADEPLKHDRRTTVAGRGARLLLRNNRRCILAVVLFFEISKIAGRPNDRDAERIPIALLSFSDRRCGRLFGGFNINGFSYAGRVIASGRFSSGLFGSAGTCAKTAGLISTAAPKALATIK
jgi:hypothetical protein